MKKIKALMLTLLVIVCLPIFAACNGNDSTGVVNAGWIEVSAQHQNLVIKKGESVTLSYQVMPIEATDKSVIFESSDSSIARVDENGVITAVSTGIVVIKVRSAANELAVPASVNVSVVAEKVLLNAPENILYDKQTKTVSWDEAPVPELTGVLQNSFKPLYQLNIKIDGVAQEPIVLSTTQYNNIQEGHHYEISVTSLGNEYMFLNSEPSTPIMFTQLALPNDLKVINDGDLNVGERNFHLTFELSNYAPLISDYNIEIKSIIGGVINDADKLLWDEALKPENIVIEENIAKIKIPSDLSAGDYVVNISVKEKLDSQIYGVNALKQLTVTKLPAPTALNLSIINESKQLSWSTVRNISKYKIKLIYVMTDGENKEFVAFSDAGTTLFNLNDISGLPNEGEYEALEIYMYAIAKDVVATKQFIDSDISDVEAKQQLKSVTGITISRNEAESRFELVFGNVVNAAQYNVYIGRESSRAITVDDKLVGTVSSPAINLLFNQTYGEDQKPVWAVGNNYIKIVAVAPSNSKYTDSTPTVSDEVLVKLGSLENSFKVENGVLVWEPVEGANEYVIDFGGQRQVTLDKNTLSYEPTNQDMNTNVNYSIMIYAKNTLDSRVMPSEYRVEYALYAYKLGTIDDNRVTIKDGVLSWEWYDSLGSLIQADKCEINICDQSGTVLSSFVTNNGLDIAERLNALDLDTNVFIFKLRALDTYGVNINGDFTTGIRTYQLKTPKNLRIDNGVLTWDAFDDDQIQAGHTGIFYELNIGNISVGTNNDFPLTINATSAVVTGLKANTNYRAKLRLVIDSSRAGEFGVTTETNTYIINSNYSEELSVYQLANPSTITITEQYKLSWSASNKTINKYLVELYKLNENRVRGEKPIFIQIVSPQDINNPYFTFSDIYNENGVPVIMEEGAYQFTVYSIGDVYYSTSSDGRYGSLTSYNSEYYEIYKLGIPQMQMSNGVLTWSNVYNKLENANNRVTFVTIFVYDVNGNLITTYDLKDTANATELPGLSTEEWAGKTLQIKIQARSTWKPRVYDGEVSLVYMAEEKAISKLGKIRTSDCVFKGTELIWPGSVNTKYTIYLYHKNPLGTYSNIITTTITDNRYSLPNLNGGEYYIQIKTHGRNGDNHETLNSDLSDAINFQRFAQPMGITISRDANDNPILNFSVNTPNPNSQYRINVLNLDNTGGEISNHNYYVPYNTFSFNLNGTEVNEKLGGKYSRGTLQICISTVSKTSGTADANDKIVNESNQTIHLVDSIPSSYYYAFVYESPQMVFDGGELTWTNNNPSDKGTLLQFVPINLVGSIYQTNENDVITIDLSPNVRSYDVSALNVGQYYLLRSKAKGNTNQYIASDYINCEYVIQVMNPLLPNNINSSNVNDYNGWYVKDGEIYWNKVEGASAYVLRTTNKATNVVRTESPINEADEVRKTQLEITPGTYDLQFMLVGGPTEMTIDIQGVGNFYRAYLNSSYSSGVEITKLADPTKRDYGYMRVENGEFDFGVRGANNAWVDDTGATAYGLIYGSAVGDAIIYPLDGNEYRFIASETFLNNTKGEYNMSVYSVGNTVITPSGGGICLTSSSSAEFKLLYNGEITDFAVKEGALLWDEMGSGNISKYHINYKIAGDPTIYQARWNENTFSFEGISAAKGAVIEYVKVRFAGADRTKEIDTEGYVNSPWSTSLTEIVKLPDLENVNNYSSALVINSYGEVEWNYGSEYLKDLFNNLPYFLKISLKVYYGNDIILSNAEGWSLEKSITSMALPQIPITDDMLSNPSFTVDPNMTYSPRYELTAYVDIDYSNGTVPSSKYIRSDNKVLDGYRLGEASKFEIDTVNGPGLRFNWDVSTSSLKNLWDFTANIGTDILADNLLFTYRKINDGTIYRKIIKASDVGNIPLWEIAQYEIIELTATNSAGKAFASTPLSLRDIKMMFFESGNGTQESPFVLKDTARNTAFDQLGLTYWLPELYFELGQDINLTNLSTLRIANPSLNTNIPVPSGIKAAGVDEIYGKLILTGGLYGNGYSIKNLQVSAQADSLALWNEIIGGASAVTLPVDNKFYNRKGIINNVRIEAYTVDISGLNRSYNGFFANENYGWITNCTLDGCQDESKFDANSNYIPVVSGRLNVGDIYFGGIAGLNGKKTITTINEDTGETIYEYMYDGRIDSSTNFLNFNIYSDNENDRTNVGGIAGINFAGNIIDCSNGTFDVSKHNRGSIGGKNSGGIVGEIKGIEITIDETTKEYTYAFVSGCINYGTVTNWKIVSNDTIYASSAGIAAILGYGYVTYCINFGTITTTSDMAILGGLVGSQTDGGYTLCSANSGVISYNQMFDSENNTHANAGTLLGDFQQGKVYNCWSENDGIIVTKPDTTTISGSNWTGVGLDPIDCNRITNFTTMSDSERTAFLESINKTLINITSGSDIVTQYPRYDGKVATIVIEANGEPVITWVNR